MDPISIACSLLDGSQALRNDANRYLGSRRDWRIAKADAMEARALKLAGE